MKGDYSCFFIWFIAQYLIYATLQHKEESRFLVPRLTKVVMTYGRQRALSGT